ncbi:MAG: alginate export family protein [Omnitrophica bacterium]|nr:alginate export family protein [Candidatus Omnitrophota bacterium]
MSRKIALFCALIGLVAFVAAPAYAEVQNIKISGDIQSLAVYRNNYDLEDGRNYWTANQISEYLAEDSNSFLQSIVRLRIDADLTDNVAAAIRLTNVREWDNTVTADERDIVLDLAYVTLKEMLYSPLTLVIGRQELLYGSGLIVGPGRFQDDFAVLYDDLVPLHGFDAVRAILDYDPWTLDLILVKIEEAEDVADTTAGDATDDRDSDVDLYGANLGYRFDQYDAEAEAYLFFKRDENYALTVTANGSPSNLRTFTENYVYTLGLRGSAVPLDNLTLRGEIAGQLGHIGDPSAGPDGGDLELDREGLMIDVSGEYDFADVRFNPIVGVEYLYLSGEEAGVTGDFGAWDPMYRSRFIGTIRDALENLYTTGDPADTSGWTNQHTIKAMGSLDLGELVDGLSLDLAYLHYWFDEEPIAGADDDIGDEITMRLAYDYTEDVEFFLDGAWFFPGDYYADVHRSFYALPGEGNNTGNSAATNVVRNRVSNDTAVSLIGSVKVSF